MKYFNFFNGAILQQTSWKTPRTLGKVTVREFDPSKDFELKY